MSTSIRTRKYEDMFPDEVLEEIGRHPVIYMAFGGLEIHGPHNPLGIDVLPFYGIALAAAARAGGVVHPPVYMAVAGHPPRTSAELRAAESALGPPSVWHGRELVEAWLDETLWNFEKIGFTIGVLIPGHAPNIYLAHEWCEKMKGRCGKMSLVVCDGLPMIAQAGFTREESGHGAMMESAWLEALYPGMVDLSKVRQAIRKEPGVKALDERYAWDSRKVASYRRMAVEKGRKFVNLAVEWIVREVARLEQKPGERAPSFCCCPGYVSTYRVSRVRSFDGHLDLLQPPGQAEIRKFAVREFRRPLCVVPEMASGSKNRPRVVDYAFNLVCPKSMSLELGLGYDGPVKVWVDRQVRLTDSLAIGPASGKDGGDKSVLPLELSRGKHKVQVALVSNQGRAAGIFVRMRRGHDAGGAPILANLPEVDVGV